MRMICYTCKLSDLHGTVISLSYVCFVYLQGISGVKKNIDPRKIMIKGHYWRRIMNPSDVNPFFWPKNHFVEKKQGSVFLMLYQINTDPHRKMTPSQQIYITFKQIDSKCQCYCILFHIPCLMWPHYILNYKSHNYDSVNTVKL